MLARDGRVGALLGCGLWLLGCGDQASTDYQGEPLLTLRGSVELLTASDRGPLVPAVALMGPHGYWSVVDVEVEGEFPAGFTLRVYEPPPEEAMWDAWGELLDTPEPRQAFGYITAAAADHPPGFQHINVWSTTTDCSGLDDCRRVQRRFCFTESDDQYEPLLDRDIPESNCYIETRECDFAIDFQREQDYESCPVVDTLGDPALGERAGTRFEGVSQGYGVLYLETAAAAGSLTARLMSVPEGAPAGYHVLSYRQRTEREIAEVDACLRQATGRAFEQHLAQRGSTTCELTPELGIGFSCDDDSEGMALATVVYRTQGELQCPIPGDQDSRVVDVERTELSIRIGHGLDGIGFPSP